MLVNVRILHDITKTQTPMRIRILKNILFLSLIALSQVLAQVNPPLIEVTVKQGETVADLQLFSIGTIDVVEPFQGDIAGGGFTIDPFDANLKNLNYTASTDFAGNDRAVFACSESLFGPKTYVAVEINVVRSILVANADFAEISAGESEVIIDVLANDEYSENVIEVLGAELVRDGQVEVLGDGAIKFLANNDFEGITNFAYIVSDDLGTTADGVVTINRSLTTPAINETLRYTVSSGAQLSLSLPTSGFVLAEDSEVLFGALEGSSPFSFNYKPEPYATGVEVFTLVNDDLGLTRTIEIEIIKSLDAQQLVQDDEVYTSKGQYVLIDALSNDYSQNVAVIDYSPELNFGGGIFSYLPEDEFEGVKQFYYTIHDGMRSYTGSIDVYVGDYVPKITSYDFVTQKNTPLVLEYNIPIRNFNFKVIEAASSGEVAVNQSAFYHGDCNNAIGYQMVSYTPSSDFIGSDQFSIEYCVSNGACQTIDVAVEVIESDDECVCVGPDCVWAGDANKDGVVNVADVLAIGIHYGESGEGRELVSEWGADHASDWAATEDGTNAKFADTDGDGVITANDTESILTNYNKFDNLVPSAVLIDKSIPLRFEVSNPNPEIGDEVTIDIYAGSEEYPVVDLHGVALAIDVPSSYTDSTSISFEVSSEGLGQGSPVIGLSYSSEGRIEVGASRTVDIGISGEVPLGTVSIGIKTDIDQLRPGSDEIPIDLIIPAAMMTDGAGRQYKLEGGMIPLRYQLASSDDADDIIIDEVDVLAFPNPSKGQLSLHANGQDILHDVSIYNTVGALVYEQKAIGTNHLDINNQFAQGMYIAHITTQKGKTIQKIEVIQP